MSNAASKLLSSKPGQYAVLGVVGVALFVIVYKFLKREVVAGAQAVGGIASGKNELTKGTPYEGAGIVGTLGAAANEISGGVLGEGGWFDGLGGWLYDATHEDLTERFNKPVPIRDGAPIANVDDVVSEEIMWW